MMILEDIIKRIDSAYETASMGINYWHNNHDDEDSDIVSCEIFDYLLDVKRKINELSIDFHIELNKMKQQEEVNNPQDANVQPIV